MELRIFTIDEESPFLKVAMELGNENADVLGFLPQGAFIEYAKKGQILVALDKSDNLQGYLVYGKSHRKLLAYIVHLCVEKTHRHRGVARKLFKQLKEETRASLHGIRVRCRRDYEASSLWPKLGFIATNEIAGRGKHDSILTVWWYDFHHPTLFTYIEKRRTGARLKVVLDANVFYQLQEDPNSRNQESRALVADWLQENVELCVTSEILNEIDRYPDRYERKRRRNFADWFTMISGTDDDFQNACRILREYYPEEMSTSDESDLRQLAWTVASQVQYFVTRDSDLLANERMFYNRFGLMLMRPAELIVRQDELTRDEQYQPARLAGSQMTIERIPSSKITALGEIFRAHQGETKGEFRQRIGPCLADPRMYKTVIIRLGGSPMGLITYGLVRDEVLDVPLLRLVRNSLSSTLARYLIVQSILDSTRLGRELIVVSDPYLTDSVTDALREVGFNQTHSGWLRASMMVTDTAIHIADRLSILEKALDGADDYFQKLSDALTISPNEIDASILLDLERTLWLTKIIDVEIPAYMVPIRPEWAMHLFDTTIASQDLFGSEPSLAMSFENVYYRVARPKLFKAPARLLWYVSKGSGGYQSTKSVKACSYLDEVLIGKPKRLFSRYRRLGVYEWQDVLKIAGGDYEKDIMAFKFSGSQLFSKPVPRRELENLWHKNEEKKFHIQGPISISKQMFFRLYKLGFPSH